MSEVTELSDFHQVMSAQIAAGANESNRSTAPLANGLMGQAVNPTNPVPGMGVESSSVSFAGSYGAVQQSGSIPGDVGDVAARPGARHISTSASVEIAGPRQEGVMSGSCLGEEQGAALNVAPVHQPGVAKPWASSTSYAKKVSGKSTKHDCMVVRVGSSADRISLDDTSGRIYQIEG